MFNSNRIAEKFHNDFNQYKDVPMAVYGMGNNSKAVLQDSEDFLIQCVIVKDPSSDIFCGKPVHSIEEALANGIRIIVIAAEADIELIIYDRIREICNKNNVLIRGIHLGNIEAIFSRNRLYGFSKDEHISRGFVEKQIEEHDVVSFDIFDTLLMRKTLYPQDVFFLMEEKIRKENIDIENFPMQRMHAEVSNPQKEPNLDEIYDYLQSMVAITKEQADWLKKLEIETEDNVLTIKVSVYEMLKYAKQKGKEVYLVSDMYLPEYTLQKLLSDVGITEYDGIFVSNKYRTGKTEDLYDEYVNGIGKKKYLHIGDNKKADGICAVTHGLDAIILPSTYELIEKSPFADILTRTSNIVERLMVGLFAMRYFNNPFLETYKINNVSDYAYLFLGPVISAYMLWLIAQIKRYGYTKVLFAARDGWLFLRLYHMAEVNLGINLPEGSYFYTSRKACIRAYCSDKRGLSEVMDRYSFTMDDIGRNFSGNGKWEPLSEIEVYERGKNERAGYQRYIDSFPIDIDDKIGFVDLASGGSCQYFLEEMFLPKMTGLYFCQTGSTAKRMPTIHAASREWSAQTEFFSKIDNKVLIEAVMSSPEPSLGGFSKKGEPVFMPENRTESDKKFIMDAQEGITEFFSDFSQLLSSDEAVHPAVTRALLGYKDIANVSNDILSHIYLEDELINVSFGVKKG